MTEFETIHDKTSHSTIKIHPKVARTLSFPYTAPTVTFTHKNCNFYS